MTGMHALGGVVLALGATRLARSRWQYPPELLGVVAFGIVVGAMLPDTDFILTVPIVPFDRELGEAFHRSFTHSFVVFLPIVVAGAPLFRRGRHKLGLLVVWITFQMRDTVERFGVHGLSNARTHKSDRNVPSVPRLEESLRTAVCRLSRRHRRATRPRCVADRACRPTRSCRRV